MYDELSMSRSSSRTPSLTPSRSPSPVPPTQPDHFYGAEAEMEPRSPGSDGKTWLDPDDDPTASRGIPVFKPTMAEFEDFEGYMNSIECWGNKSGIVKVIPPKEWTDSLPPVKPQLAGVKIKSPIEQHMIGQGGLFRQENMEKRKVMTVREWAQLCRKEDFTAPGVDEISLSRSEKISANARNAAPKAIKPKRGKNVESNDPSGSVPPPEPKATSAAGRKEAKEALDAAFLETFEPHSDWLPPSTTAESYTPDFCRMLERHYWRNCGLNTSPWYGADTQGSLYTDETKAWNVAHLPSMLERLLPPGQGLPGVNTPYLYFGMWRATFAWHVEDMDLFSINYIHFGAPKFWYAVPQARANALETNMKGWFPQDTSTCPQFLRHKSFLASPTLLAHQSIKPNTLVQHAGEFVITFPRGYHAGFNLGFNCAESVNFALDSWLALGRKAKVCECIGDSVRINVDQLLIDREAEKNAVPEPMPVGKVRLPKYNEDGSLRVPVGRKRKSETLAEDGSVIAFAPRIKRPRIKREVDDGPDLIPVKLKKVSRPPRPPTAGPSSLSRLPKISKIKTEGESSRSSITGVKLKLGPAPTGFPCCLCVSTSTEGLLRVSDPPFPMNIPQSMKHVERWMAHKECAMVIPETWVDDADEMEGMPGAEQVVFGVDAIVKDRWSLKCSSCAGTRYKNHGAPVQCTKGKCSKAFHVSCARDGEELGIVYTILREVETEVVTMRAVEPKPAPTQAAGSSAADPVNDAAASTSMSADAPLPPVNEVLPSMRVDSPSLESTPPEASSSSAQIDPSLMEVDPPGLSISPGAAAVALLGLPVTFNSPPPSAPMTLPRASSMGPPTRPSPSPTFNPPAAVVPVASPLLSFSASSPQPTLLKIIRKSEVQVLCPQHNPVLAAAKKAGKQDKLRADLVALQPMCRIKVKVSAGVFEVSFLRIIDETKSVEVLWDKGTTREFKWGAVVFGNFEGPVQQRPSDFDGISVSTSASAAAPPPPPTHTQPVPSSSSSTLPPATSNPPTRPPKKEYQPRSNHRNHYSDNRGHQKKQQSHGYGQAAPPAPHPHVYGGPPAPAPYYYAAGGPSSSHQSPPYQQQQHQYGYQQPVYGYGGYYQGPPPTHNGYGHAPQNGYGPGPLQPHYGPPPSQQPPPPQQYPQYPPTAATQQYRTYDNGEGQLQWQPAYAGSSHAGYQPPPVAGAPQQYQQPPLGQPQQHHDPRYQQQLPVVPVAAPINGQLVQAMNQITTIGSLQPSQIEALLKDNPELKKLVQQAVEKHKTGGTG